MSRNCYITLKKSVNLERLSHDLNTNLNDSTCNGVYYSATENGFEIASGQNVVVPCELKSDKLQDYAMPTANGSYIKSIDGKLCPGNMGVRTLIDDQYVEATTAGTIGTTATVTTAASQVASTISNKQHPCKEFLIKFLNLFKIHVYRNVTVLIGNYTLRNNTPVIVIFSETLSVISELELKIAQEYRIPSIFKADGVIVYPLDELKRKLPNDITTYLDQCKSKNPYIAL